MNRAFLAAAALLVAVSAPAQEDSAQAEYNAAGGTELMDAAYYGHLAQAKKLILKGVDLNAEDNNSETALMYAVSSGHDDIVRLLLAKGANTEIPGPSGNTALFYAALKDRAEAARMILEKGAKPDAPNLNGYGPLSVAVSNGSAKVAAVLLEKGASVNAKDPDGSTPLMTAVVKVRPDLAQLLLSKGADPNLKNNAGSTALILAAASGQSDIVKLLLEKGANVDLRDNHDETALEYAKAGNHVDSAALIQKVFDERAAAKAKEDQAAREKQAAEDAERARKAAEEEARRRAEKHFPWGLALGGLAAAAVLGGAFAFSSARKKKQEAKEQAVADVKVLMRVDMARAYAAFLDYQGRWRDTKVFTPAELLQLYEERDRQKRAQRGTAPTELPRTPQVDGARTVEEALALARQGKTAQALERVSGEAELTAAARLEEGCEAVIEVFERAGALATFFDKIFAGKGREFQLPYARAFLRMGKPAECRRALELVRVKDRDGRAMLAEALAMEERLDEAARALGEGPKGDWSVEEWAAYFRLSLKRREKDQAEQAFDRIKILRPPRKDPRWYYGMAEACEVERFPELAGELYDAFSRADFAYRDAAERAKRLDGRRHAEDRAERIAKRAGPAPAPAREKAPLIGGRYELGAPLGEGRLGPVFAGREDKSGKPVALRRLKPEALKDRSRFMHEAKLVSHLSHPFIVGLLDTLEDPTGTYLVYELVEGGSLAKKLAAGKKLGLLDCRPILDRVCQAAEYAHLRNIVHKDIKPANILLDAKGQAKLADFSLTPGTPAYMAPEHHAGKPVRSSDVFSLAVTFYEMVTGALPFAGPDFEGQKRAKAFVPARSLVPELPKDIDAVFAAALDPDPANRMGEASEFFQELKRL